MQFRIQVLGALELRTARIAKLPDSVPLTPRYRSCCYAASVCTGPSLLYECTSHLHTRIHMLIAFDTLKVKSLNEIHQEKLHPTLTHGYQHRTYVPAKKPMSFELRSVLQVSGVKVHPNSNAGGSNDAQQMLPAKPATAVMRTKTIFAGSQDMSSIFSPEYKGSDSKDSIETVPHVRTKQESLTVPSSDKEAQSGRYSKRSTPAGAQENSAPADQPTSASADQGIPKSGQPGGIITSHMGEKRPQVAMETKREQPVAKKVCSTV